MTLDYSNSLRKLENLMAREKLPSFCQLMSSTDGRSESPEEHLAGDPSIAIVFPMKKERLVYDFLRRHREELRTLFGNSADFRLYTILYHLAYSRFSLLSSNRELFFISTNIDNLDNPVISKSHNKAERYGYVLKEVVVGLSSMVESSVSLEQRMAEIANEFNKESRYIKICELWVSYTISATARSTDPPLHYKRLSIDSKLY